MTPQELADRLIGSCENVVIEEEIPDDVPSSGVQAWLDEFDNYCFCCSSCSWWCSTDELNDGELCDDCNDAEDDT